MFSIRSFWCFSGGRKSATQILGQSRDPCFGFWVGCNLDLALLVFATLVSALLAPVMLALALLALALLALALLALALLAVASA